MRFVALIVSIVAVGQLLASQDPATPREDPKVVIDRLRSKRFPEADDRLEARDPGARAQMLQEKIIEDLDKLLDRNDDRFGRKSKRRSQAKDAGTQDPDAAKPASGQRESDVKDLPARGKNGTRGDGTGIDRKDPGKTSAESDRQRGIWPPMPARKRQEMDAYGKDKLLPKYEKLIGEYCRTIAEQSKRRESE